MVYEWNTHETKGFPIQRIEHNSILVFNTMSAN